MRLIRRSEQVMRRFLAWYIVLYHPEHIEGFSRCSDGLWMASYGLGPLRVRLFGCRVPVLWAFETLIKTECV